MSRALLPCALFLVVVVAGSRLPARPGPAAGERLDEIRALLDRRADALLRGDRSEFLATVDPADPTFGRRQRLLFDGFRQLGLEEYVTEIPGGPWPVLTTPREVGRYGSGSEVTVLHVRERYAIEGYDAEPALDDLYLTFVRRADGWRLASDSDLEDLTLFSGRKLWESGPVTTRESEHFLFVAHPDLAGAAPSILAVAERALSRVAAAWPFEWHRRVVLLVPRTEAELRRLVEADFDLDVFVAFASSALDRTVDWDLAGHRIILNWPAFARSREPSREAILTHELVHVATRELAGPAMPVFVDEGVAEWVAGDDDAAFLAARISDGSFDRRLPLDHEFVTGSDSHILLAYQESSSAIRYAAARFGDGAVARFYRHLGSTRLAPGTWRYHADRAMRSAFGVGYERFEGGWAGWAERTFG